MALIDELRNETLLEICWNHIYCNKPPDIRKDSQGIDKISLQKFEDNRETYLNALYQKLCDPDFKLSSLKGIAKVKSNGKYRLLSVPTVEDRIVHKAILVIVAEYIYPFINTGVSHCGIRKNILEQQDNGETYSIQTALKALIANVKAQKFWVLKADISGFFDNIIKVRLLEKLKGVLPDNSLDNILRQIIFPITQLSDDVKAKTGVSETSTDVGVSQGSSLSPIFSNLYLSDFDGEMYELCGKSLIRYADDFVVMASTKDEIDKFEKVVKLLLEKEGLSLAEEKTEKLSLKTDTLEFLGLKINRHKITITNKKEKEILSNVQEYFTSAHYKESEKVEKKKLEEEIEKQKRDGKLEKEAVIAPQQFKKLINRRIIARINSKVGGVVQCYKHYSVENLFKKIDQRVAERKKSSPNYSWLLSASEHTKIEHIIPTNQWQSYFSKDPTSKASPPA